MIYNTVFCPGSYGTYVAWSVYTYSELNTSQEILLPFGPNGSCHLFRNHLGITLVPTVYNLPTIKSNVIYIQPEKQRSIEYLDNQLAKQSEFDNYDILNSILKDYKEKLLDHWGTNNPAKWQERELLSFFLPDMFNTQWLSYFEVTLDEFNAIKINANDICKDFRRVIENILNFFNLKSIGSLNKLEEIHKIYLSLQKHLDKGQLTLNYAESSIIGKKFTINNLTLYDEAWIQHLLRNKGFEIKCFELNEFPLCSSELTPLLEKI